MIVRNRKRVVTPAQLLALLETEFLRSRPPGCKTCRIPLPYRIERPDEVSANWDIGPPANCPYRCHARVAEVVARLWTEYDLEEPAAFLRDDNGRRLH